MSNGDLVPHESNQVVEREFTRDDLALVQPTFDAFERNAEYLTEAEVESELNRIAEYRRTNRAAYVRDEQAQRRERELLALKEIGFLQLDPELIEEWRQSGGIELRLKMARETIAIALNSLNHPDQRELVEGFDALPPNVQTQIFRFIALDPSKSVRPVSNTTLENFKAKEVGAALSKEWGSQAAYKLAQIQGTIAMMSRKVSKADDQTARDWFDTLPASQQKAALRALAK